MNTEETNHAIGCQCREIAHCPVKHVSQYLSYSRDVCKHRNLCGISFCFSVPCRSSYMPRAVAAYKYNWYGLMHIQLFYFKYYIFWGTCWVWEPSWRTEAAAQQICGRAELLARKIHGFFKYENETTAGISNVHNKPSLLTKGSTTAIALFSHARRGLSTAFSGNWWEFMLFGTWKNLCIEGHSSQRCQFYPNYKQQLQILSLRQNFFFLQGINTLHTEPKALKCSDESACEWGPELPQPSSAEPKKMLRPQQVAFQTTSEDPMRSHNPIQP